MYLADRTRRTRWDSFRRKLPNCHPLDRPQSRPRRHASKPGSCKPPPKQAASARGEHALEALLVAMSSTTFVSHSSIFNYACIVPIFATSKIRVILHLV